MTTLVEHPTTSAPAAAPRVGPGGAGRLGWIDTARGLIMLTVVVMHVGIYEFLGVIADADPAAQGFWNDVNAQLGAIRMPALLIISGWLASSTVAGGIRSPRTRKRLAANGWLFVLWMGIYAVVTTALGAQSSPQSVTLASLPRQLLLPDSTLWFLIALVWYTALLASVRTAPRWFVLATLLALSAVSTTLLSTNLGLWVKIPQYAVFFALGAYSKRIWKWIAEHPLICVPASGVAVWASIQWENYQTQVAHQWSYPSETLSSLAMAALLFSAAGFVSRHVAVLARPLSLVGRNTIAVYALHFPLILALVFVPGLRAAADAALTLDPVRWLWPVLVTVVIAALAVAIKGATDAVGVTWLFGLPARPAWLRVPAWARRALAWRPRLGVVATQEVEQVGL